MYGVSMQMTTTEGGSPMNADPITCTLCGGEVTAKDPARYPYCRTCHYTGSAAEHIRVDQVQFFAAAFPEAEVSIEHTGGGCMWLAIRWTDAPKYIVLTDGEACLPETDDGEPVRGGWGYVGRHDDTDDESNPDYEGTELWHGGYADEAAAVERLSDEAAVEMIRERFPRMVTA
jgi:hypothetical protein